MLPFVSIQLKLYPPKRSDVEAARRELHHALKPRPNSHTVVIEMTGSETLTVLESLKDGKVRFKLRGPDGTAREWSPARRGWIESDWAD
jgi:hypothetical protein